MTVPSPALRIAQIAPPSIACPPNGYGASELVASTLTEELVRQGHDVTLFAHPESTTSAGHVFFPEVYALTKPEDRELAHMALAFERAGEFDIIHNHCIQPGPAAIHTVDAALTTLHYVRPLLRTFASHPYVALSRSQRLNHPDLNIVGVAYNGIDCSTFDVVDEKEEYLLWIGRIDPKKGPHLAIEVARRTGRRLLLAAGHPTKDNLEYWERQVKPGLGGGIEYIGHVTAAEKPPLIGRAQAVLMPHQWEEPFGLVAIEAMAAGTPVIAFRRGALPEIVPNGIGGMVVDTVEEMAGMVPKVESIDPWMCRRHVEENFSAAAMAASYVAIYQRVLETPRILTLSSKSKQAETAVERAS